MKRLLTIAVLLALTPPVSAGRGVIDAELEAILSSAKPGEPVPVIVHFADRVRLEPFRHGDRARRRREMILALREKAERTQETYRAILEAHGISNAKQLWLINAMAFSAPAGLVRAAARWPGVERIVHDETVDGPGARYGVSAESREPTRSTEQITATPEWNIDAIGAPSLWAMGFDGQGVVVAIVDSGVSPGHQDLESRYRGGSNSWFDPYGEQATPADLTGHGTNTAGVIVGGNAGGTAIGVAPGAQWIAARIFDDLDQSTLSAIHQALAWTLDPDGQAGTDDGADVVSNSWGLRDNLNECVTEFQSDIQALEAADVAVVASAGNDGPAGSTSVSPANYPETTAVGAVDDSLTIASFSGRGPSACGMTVYPELVAPGVDIWTTDRTFGGVFTDLYLLASGTSIAAPHVAGAFALLRQAFPQASVEQLEGALTTEAFDLGTSGPDNDYGHGFVDLVAAHTLLASSGCTDGDADGVMAEGGDCGPQDCDDGNGNVWAAPGETGTLVFDSASFSLAWQAPALPGATPGSTTYDVLRSDDAADFDAAECIPPDDPLALTATDTATPSSFELFHYLVRAGNACPAGMGSLGGASDGTERSGALCP